MAAGTAPLLLTPPPKTAQVRCAAHKQDVQLASTKLVQMAVYGFPLCCFENPRLTHFWVTGMLSSEATESQPLPDACRHILWVDKTQLPGRELGALLASSSPSPYLSTYTHPGSPGPWPDACHPVWQCTRCSYKHLEAPNNPTARAELA